MEPILAHTTEVGGLVEPREPGLEGVGDEIILGGPPPVDRGLAGLGTGRDATI